MKKTSKRLLVVAGLLFALLLFSGGVSYANAYAEEQSSNVLDFEALTHQIFGDVEIESCDELYGLDGSSDFVCVDFKDDGYVIYDKATMEMLEYSQTGSSRMKVFPKQNITVGRKKRKN